ncbi:MAG: exosortase, partial [Proteobacteria bacterium]|nr:exosortase [Pseudomonadota bacterium]
MTAYVPIQAAPDGALTPWRRQLLLLGLATAVILIAFGRDAADIADIWWRSDTFGHCPIVAVMIGWLVWQRRALLAELTPRSWAPGLLLVGMGAGGWLLGDAAGVAQARHLGLLFMLQGAVVSLLGPSVSRGLLFPLGYALFLVPFGEELVPPLQTLTAKMCMALLGLVGLPAHIDGVFITTPTGYFEVAEACSGVNFLIAMFAYAVL